MREIRFRAWDEEDKEMFRVVMIAEIGDKRDNLLVSGRGGTVKNPILMQYTGLKDKNGLTEIYEGDILALIKPMAVGRVEVCFGKYDDSEIEYGSSGIGWFVKGYHGYKQKDGSINKYEIGNGIEGDWSLDRCLDWEVIGNIYENKGLICTL